MNKRLMMMVMRTLKMTLKMMTMMMIAMMMMTAMSMMTMAHEARRSGMAAASLSLTRAPT